MQTRRHFLRDCSIVAASAAAVTPWSAWSGNPRYVGWAPNASLFAGFASLVNTAFAVYGTSEAAKLVLLEARPAPPVVPGAEDDGNERFSLFFCGSNREPLEQDTYVFEHPRMGRMPIFITRIGSMDTTHCYYEAVFNHPVSPWGVAAQLSRAPRSVTND